MLTFRLYDFDRVNFINLLIMSGLQLLLAGFSKSAKFTKAFNHILQYYCPHKGIFMINDFTQDLREKVLEFDKNHVVKDSAQLIKEYTHESTGILVRLQTWDRSVSYGKWFPENKIQIITDDCDRVKAAVMKMFDHYSKVYDTGDFELDEDDEDYDEDYDITNEFKVEFYRTIKERDKAI